MIQLEKLSFQYPQGTVVFKDFNLKIDLHSSWAVLGPSGCGKTTLLYLISGLQHPSSGKVIINGTMLTHPRPQTGLILQDYGLLPWSTVRQNVELGLQIRRFYGPDGKHAPDKNIPMENVDHWLSRLGLDSIQDNIPQNISGGQRQRTAIARTLVLEPDILLMDEPFASLDAPTRNGLQKLTKELWNEQALTLILVTHSIEEAVLMGQYILLLSNPPISEPLTIENFESTIVDYQDTDEYQNRVRQLRDMMEEYEKK
jgi:NitT/TauT family transport system ATP-binding protein